MNLRYYPSLVPKDHPRYSSAKNKYDQILGKHNDRLILDFIERGSDKEEYE